MPVLGITGGIATGKSSFVSALVARFPKLATSSVVGDGSYQDEPGSRVASSTHEGRPTLERSAQSLLESAPETAANQPASSANLLPKDSRSDRALPSSVKPSLALLKQSPTAGSNVRVFDADATAHELLQGDEDVRSQIVDAFGSAVLGTNGWPDRLQLRAVVFGNLSARRQIEEILHPIIRQRWITLAHEYHTRPDWLLVDIPLLYETEAQRELTRVVVVACSPATQLHRLRTHRQLAEETITSILAAQLDLGVKVAAAQHVVWNDSSPACLQWQASLLADSLRYLYG